MASVYAKAETSLELELHRVQSVLPDAKVKLKKANANLKYLSKVNEDLAKAEEDLKICHSQNCFLEDHVANLTVNAAPLGDEPENL